MTAAEDAVAAALDGGMDYRYPTARKVLDALRSLPVEQRMEAMGMERVRWTGPATNNASATAPPMWVEKR
jgi:hypothetical protein